MGGSIQRKRKRSFHGNKYAKANKGGSRPIGRDCSNDKDETYASAKKLKLGSEKQQDCTENVGNYLLISSTVLEQIIRRIAKCPLCCSKVNFENKLDRRQGFCYMLSFNCISCDWNEDVFSSPFTKKAEVSPGKNQFDVNKNGFCISTTW